VIVSESTGLRGLLPIGLGYRALGTDYSIGNFGYDVIARGPIAGGELRF